MSRAIAVAVGGALALLAASASGVAWAQDAPAPAGDVKAGLKLAHSICQTCHGLNGIATMPEAANLAGQDTGYLFRQLTAFHSGERKNEMMTAVGQMLSPQQMADVAAYYGGIKISVQSPAK